MPDSSRSIDPNDFELTRAPVLDASLPPPYFFTSQEFLRTGGREYLSEGVVVCRAGGPATEIG